MQNSTYWTALVFLYVCICDWNMWFYPSFHPFVICWIHVEVVLETKVSDQKSPDPPAVPSWPPTLKTSDVRHRERFSREAEKWDPMTVQTLFAPISQYDFNANSLKMAVSGTTAHRISQKLLPSTLSAVVNLLLNFRPHVQFSKRKK